MHLMERESPGPKKCRVEVDSEGKGKRCSLQTKRAGRSPTKGASGNNFYANGPLHLRDWDKRTEGRSSRMEMEKEGLECNYQCVD
jgi:hypothetical protein